MSRISTMHRIAGASALLLGAQGGAWAQVSPTIGYVPDATAVPTLSEWTMVVLSVLLAGTAVYMARKGGHRLLSMLLGAAALVLGVAVEQDVFGTAQANGVVQMSSATGGTVIIPFIPTGFEEQVQGHPTVPMRIISVTPASDTPTTNSPTCTVGTLVPAGGACWYKMPGAG